MQSTLSTMAATSDPASPPTLTVFKAEEVFNLKTDEFCSLSVLFTDGHDYYFYEHTDRRLPDDVTLLAAQAILIPRTYYQALPPHGLHHAPENLPDHIYLKVSLPLNIVDAAEISTTGVADSFVQEAQVYHELAKKPHPNIAEYFGIYVQDGLMTGICLRRYSKTLFQSVKDGDQMDIDSIVNGIKIGLQYLHSLDYVHVGRTVSWNVFPAWSYNISQGDINPHNIMFDAMNLHVPVIIDFDSCHKRGARIGRKAGTPGWYRELGQRIAQFENDEYGLNAIRSWLEGLHETHET